MSERGHTKASSPAYSAKRTIWWVQPGVVGIPSEILPYATVLVTAAFTAGIYRQMACAASVQAVHQLPPGSLYARRHFTGLWRHADFMSALVPNNLRVKHKEEQRQRGKHPSSRP